MGDVCVVVLIVLWIFGWSGWKRSKGWDSVANLVVLRNKIEDVRITLRRAIVVLVHAHVTLDQALRAVQAEQVCGVVTLPCCNWYGQQELIFGRGPDLVYDDFSVLSIHREVKQALLVLFFLVCKDIL